MIAIISAILGFITSFGPSILKYFERKQEIKHELALNELRIKYAERSTELNVILEEAKAAAREGDDLRRHDMSLRGGSFIESLRASIRPVITYIFFLVFVAIKGLIMWKFMETGTADFLTNFKGALEAIWDQETQAIFSAVIGFWFGQRAIERFAGRNVVPDLKITRPKE